METQKVGMKESSFGGAARSRGSEYPPIRGCIHQPDSTRYLDNGFCNPEESLLSVLWHSLIESLILREGMHRLASLTLTFEFVRLVPASRM